MHLKTAFSNFDPSLNQTDWLFSSFRHDIHIQNLSTILQSGIKLNLQCVISVQRKHALSFFFVWYNLLGIMVFTSTHLELSVSRVGLAGGEFFPRTGKDD